MSRKISFLKSVFVFILLAFQFSYTEVLKAATGSVALELDKPLTRKISGAATEKQSYQIQLSAGQYAKIVVEQTEVDTTAKLLGADGKLLAVYDTEYRLGNNEVVEFIASQAGDYTIEIQTGSKAWAGNYKITLTDVREPSERDRTVYEAQTLVGQAEDLRNAEKFDEAIFTYQRGLEIAEKLADDVLTGRILNELILTNISKGDYPAAQTLLERVTAVNSKAFGAQHPQIALTTFLRGQYYRSTGDKASADRYYRQALTAYENLLGKEHPLLFNSLLKLSGLSISLNDYDAAVAYLQRAEKIVEKNYGAEHKLMAGVVNNLGVVYMSKKENDLAERYFLRTMEIGERANESHQYPYSLTLQNLAIIYYRKKDYRRSLEFYERTLKMREKILGGEHLQVAWAHYGISGVYYAMGNPAKALQNLEHVRAIAEKSVGLYNSLTIAAIGDAARIFASQGETEKAVAYQKIHDERYEKAYASELNIGSERQKLQSATRLETLTSTTISMHLNAARDNQTALDLAALAVLQRKGRVLDAVADNLAVLRRRANEADRALLDRLSEINAQLAKLALSKPAKMPLEEYQKQLAELERQKEKLEVEINDRNAEFGVQTSTVTLDAVKAQIPDDAALIEFAVYLPLDFKANNYNEAFAAPRYIAYVLRKQGDVKYVELGDKKTIDKTVDDLRKALSNPQRKEVEKFARAADERVMLPVRALFGNATQLLVSPDGELNVIPFAALVDEKGRYLIENYSFVYLSSGRDLLRMRATQTSKSKSLIVANPAFGEQPGSTDTTGKTNGRANKRLSITASRELSDTYFAPLVATAQEARSIQVLFPDAAFLSGAQATETALKQTTAPRILHIATHGFFLQDAGSFAEKNAQAMRNNDIETQIENPLLRSGLALAGANRRESGAGDDGILTALEASGLNLWGTKLVVLSACDTGLGEIKNGEGVYGLRRAFVLAGSESLLMSLWSISDGATRELMTGYYKNLKQGVGRSAALRQTQLEMLKRKDRRHPFYWAAFIQSGEWANLDGKR